MRIWLRAKKCTSMERREQMNYGRHAVRRVQQLYVACLSSNGTKNNHAMRDESIVR